MSGQMIMSIIASLIVTGFYIFQFRRERDQEKQSLEKRTVRTFVDPWLMIVYFVFIMPFALLGGGSWSWSHLISLVTPNLISISAYMILLVVLLPLLRRHFSPMMLITLWALPNYLYFTFLPGFWHNNSKIFLTIPIKLINIIAITWLTGFIIVMGWQLIQHIIYRRKLLIHSTTLDDGFILDHWVKARKKYDLDVEIPILISPMISSPISIGLFHHSMRLLLPHTNYSIEDLDLIFAHELTHIVRKDTVTKLFIGFCTALIWFNPFAWLSRKKVSEDIELSADESVLMGADPSVRRHYANLILSSADCSRGFTTCLSASAYSLHYRLQRIVKPYRKFSGTLIISLVMFLLIFSAGRVGLADEMQTIQSSIFENDGSNLNMERLSFTFNDEFFSSYNVNEEVQSQINQYLGDLEVQRIYTEHRWANRNPDVPTIIIKYQFQSETETNDILLIIEGDKMYAYLSEVPSEELRFIIDSPVDWEYLKSLVSRSVLSSVPSLSIEFDQAIGEDGNKIIASKRIIDHFYQDVSQTWILEQQHDELTQVWNSDVNQVQLKFSTTPTEPYSIIIENWSRTERKVISSDEIVDGVLMLEENKARYRIRATFKMDADVTYEMEYSFNVIR